MYCKGLGLKDQSAIVISAPSGTGKTTLNQRLVHEVDGIEISISHTTRKKRPTEIDGDHYWFIDTQEFEAMIAAGKMLEWARVHNNLYGTSQSEIGRIQKLGKRTLLEIDVQGWSQAKPFLEGALAVFILPPSIKELWHRLETRGTDNLDTRLRRLKTARQELDHAIDYDHFIINDRLERSYHELKSLIVDQIPVSLSRSEGLAFCEKLRNEFDQAAWIDQLMVEHQNSIE